MSSSVVMAVLSDLHAHPLAENDPKAPSFLGEQASEKDCSYHPIRSLVDLIQRESLAADLLVCPGDLGDRANPGCMKYAWRQLHRISEALRADALIATSGNHDVDSRYQYNDFDAKGALQSLDPPFPLEDETLCDKYWSRNFAMIERHQCLISVLNSSAYHGTGKGKPIAEYTHGRISRSTVERIKAELSCHPKAALNVLLTHHHLLRNDLIASKDYSEMDGGDLLLNFLQTDSSRTWFIVHGHKHVPRLLYAPGGATAPVIFGAGSFSAKLYPEIQGIARNQFYLVEFPVGLFPRLGHGVYGTVRTWDWTYGVGWSAAARASGLPYQAGFGVREHPSALADQVASAVRAEPTFVEWEELCTKCPKLRYVLPQDIEKLKARLTSDHRIECLHDGEGQIVQLRERRQ